MAWVVHHFVKEDFALLQVIETGDYVCKRKEEEEEERGEEEEEDRRKKTRRHDTTATFGRIFARLTAAVSSYSLHRIDR